MIFETVWWKLSSSAICPRWLERWYFGKMSQVTALCENYIGLRRKRDLIRLSDLPLRSWNFLRRELRWDGGVKQRRWRGAQISLFTEEVQIVCKKCRDKKKKKTGIKLHLNMYPKLMWGFVCPCESHHVGIWSYSLHPRKVSSSFLAELQGRDQDGFSY